MPQRNEVPGSHARMMHRDCATAEAVTYVTRALRTFLGEGVTAAHDVSLAALSCCHRAEVSSVTAGHVAPTLGEPVPSQSRRGHVDSRHGRSDPVSPKRPLALAREICPTNAYFESSRWRSTCDRPVTHHPQPRSRDFPGTSKSPGRPPVKGLILCKPDLDH